MCPPSSGRKLSRITMPFGTEHTIPGPPLYLTPQKSLPQLEWTGTSERGDQFGPLGALYPVQRFNQTGRGVFRCAGNMKNNNTSVSSRNLSNNFDRKLTRILKGHVGVGRSV